MCVYCFAYHKSEENDSLPRVGIESATVELQYDAVYEQRINMNKNFYFKILTKLTYISVSALKNTVTFLTLFERAAVFKRVLLCFKRDFFLD